MNKLLALLLFVHVCCTQFLSAQDFQASKEIIDKLCSQEFKGRGYVDNGVNKAADYLASKYKQYNLKSFGKDYFQSYSFPVNTIPNDIECTLDNKALKTGYDFLVDAGATSLQGEFNLLHYNMNDSIEKMALFSKIKKGFAKDEAPVLHHFNFRNQSFSDSCSYYRNFPKLFITTEDKKLTHTISRYVDENPSLIFIDSVISNQKKIHIHFKNKFIRSFKSKNVIGYIEGKNKDSFIAFSAHFDHLGMQGKEAMFPGASDNASGVSMLFYLIDYYTKHQPNCNIVFMLFSGEEAGLMGSDYFTENPLFNIDKIKLLINIDIMGNAEKGIVVVNGETRKQEFDLLSSINDSLHLVPKVRIRSQTKNSDHYHFSEHGVPAVFMYSDGGQGYYHDVFDKADALQLTNYEQTGQLLIEFTNQLSRK
ncbi:MAG: M28 family peptidase [Bacteroidetes bacterium]|nr:M28 family peptidase [Bacteroidota bacterium]